MEAERQNLKKFKKDIEDHYSSVLVNKEMEFESFKESAGKERLMLMDKIREQEDFVNTQREINRNQQMEFNAREEEQNRRFAMIENEMKQLKTSKTISEKLAPSDIYAGRKTSFFDSPWLGSKTSTDFTVTKSDGTSATTSKPSSSKGKELDSTNKGAAKTTSDGTRIPYRNEAGPLPPKLAVFDGKSEWKPYFMQFTHIANKYNWDKQQKLDKLIECLRDKALKFVSTRQDSVRKDFDLLAEKLNQRFGNKDLPYTIRRQLQEVKQQFEESLEEFAERVQEMATDGYIIPQKML